MAIVILAAAYLEVVVEQMPRFSGIIRSIHAAAVLGFDGRPNTIGIGARNRDSDFALVALGQAVGELSPVVTTVGGLIDAAAGPRTGDAPGRPQHLPGCGIEHARIARVHVDIDGASLVVHKQNLLPRRAAVFRPEDAALGIGTERMSHGRYVNEIRVARVDA